jgi:RNA polymerase sigma factor (TIGR02999 family)
MAGGDVTRILSDAARGDPHAAGQLLPLVYAELRKLAARRMARESPGQTMQATDLVHEAYVLLVDVEEAQCWEGRGHFFAAAAEAMRRILVERARRKASVKHGGGLRRIDLDHLPVPCDDDRADELLAIDGLWGLDFGNGVSSGDKNALYFSAAPDDHRHGLFGSLRVVADAPIALTRNSLDAGEQRTVATVGGFFVETSGIADEVLGTAGDSVLA